MKSRTIYTIMMLFSLGANNLAAQVFSEGKIIVYSTSYYHSGLNSSVHDTISFIVTGKKWSRSSRQSEGIWFYKNSRELKKLFEDRFSIGWINADTTGFVESEQRVWLHPPRNNQYSLTEFAPFPDVRKNMQVGDSIATKLLIGEGWGEFSHSEVISTYYPEKIVIEKTDTIRKIHARAVSGDKVNTVDYEFHSGRGFLYFDYLFYNGDRLRIELVP